MINSSRIKSLGARVLPRNKLVLIGATIASTAIVGSAGVAAAQQFDHHDSGPPFIVSKCKEHYKQLGFKNVGQCVSFFEHQEHGYGGDGDHDQDHDHHDNHNSNKGDKDGDHDNDKNDNHHDH